MSSWDESSVRRDNGGRFAPGSSSEASTVLRPLVSWVPASQMPDLAFEHRDGFDPARVQEVRNENWMKPAGGVWLSPVDGSGRTGWRSAREMDGWELRDSEEVVPVSLPDDAKVLVIDSLDDLLAARHSYDPGDFEHTMMSSNGIDFEAASRDFDAVWLTRSGVDATRYNPGGPHLYAWDTESVLVLRPERLEVIR